MIPDFKTYIGESIWRNISQRSEGIKSRKEDDIDLMDLNGLYDYLTNAYKCKSGYSKDNVIMINPDETIITIGVYENKNSMMGGIDLRFEYVNSEWEDAGYNNTYAVLIADSPKSDLRQVPEWLVKELEKFAVIGTSHPRFYIIYPKDGVKTTNKFLLRVLDCILECMDDTVKYKTKLKKK